MFVGRPLGVIIPFPYYGEEKVKRKGMLPEERLALISRCRGMISEEKIARKGSSLQMFKYCEKYHE
uniref:Uncharacterized protein LOC107469673 n=1 Tax=Rhizophora mucronata TaxID=61149 RepID=A0A2P2JRS0_RHIMU